MSLYDRDMRIPDPDWMIGDDIARGINQPPENHLPDEERNVLAKMRDEVGGFVDELSALNTVSEWSVQMETTVPAAIKALHDLADALDSYHADTVGDDWENEIE
jgi:hypothetical protein